MKLVELYQQLLREKRNRNVLEVYRIIYASSISDINFKNIGNHWSDNERAISTYFVRNSPITISGKSINTDEMTQFMVIGEIKHSTINWEATDISNKEHPKESEIVTKMNSKVFIKEIYNYDTDKFVKINKWGKTGQKVDGWVKNI